MLVDKLGDGGRIEKNLKSGFKACGIAPLDAQPVLVKLKKNAPETDVNTSTISSHLSESVISILKQMRFDSTPAPRQHHTRLMIEPGKSVSENSPEKNQPTTSKRVRIASTSSSSSSESKTTDSSEDERSLT
uniref:Uncharacterized protein n=1 Tax=Romanomermis culicivorax TaxID=13658 RepID=A0A915IP78_ROMCU